MRPLFQEVLHLFTDGKERSRQMVQDELRDVYGNFRFFKDKKMDEALHTAMSNGLIGETRYELDDKGQLVMYYQSDQDMIDLINSYIK
ncbi:MAG: hypothetical protein IJV66_01205 [Firmicutes bacterium]|nr:hypothetical protein [Bacillota bacterium]